MRRNSDCYSGDAQNRIGHRQVLKWAMFILAVCSGFSITGCGGIAAYAVRSSILGKNYGELKCSIPPIPPWKGRLFVYLVDGGPSVANTGGVTFNCSVDRRICSVMGRSYWYLDLGEGKHKVTTELETGWGYSRYGKYAVEFDLKTNETKYCRINMNKGTGIFHGGSITPEMVDADIAARELDNLDYFKNFRPPVGNATIRVN